MRPAEGFAGFEHNHAPSRPRNARHLQQGAITVRNVADTEGNGRGLKGPVGEGKLLSVAGVECDPIPESRLLDLAATDFGHPAGRVDSVDSDARVPAGDRDREISGTGSNIEYPDRPVNWSVQRQGLPPRCAASADHRPAK